MFIRLPLILPKALALAFLLCAIALVPANAKPADAPPNLTPAQVAAIDRYVAAEMTREKTPGVAVGIYNRGRILLAKGYGLANVELNVPVKPETIFQSGSVGKQFTAAGILFLVEEGKLSLDDSITKFFPDAPESWKTVRIKNLLSHTSGLAEYESSERTGPAGPFYLRLDFTEDELVKKMYALPIEFQPGEKWDYRNTNYVLLGVIIHKLTGKFYADFLHDRIFAPLGMNSTRLISEADIIPNRSAGYELAGDSLKNQSWVSPTFNSTADGALYFNVLDLAKWDAALYDTSLLKQSSLDAWWTVFPLTDGKSNRAHYGFAWEITQMNGHKLIEHSGSWQGFMTHIARYVDDGITVVALANCAAADPTQIAHVVAGLANPALDPPKHTAIEDRQPDLAARMRALIGEIVAGKDVKSQLSSELAALVDQYAATFTAQVKPVWPPDSVSLLKRNIADGESVSEFRATKAGESRVITFGVAKDGKVSTLRVQRDPDLR